MQVLEGTLAWPDLGIRSNDVNGAQTFFHFDIDPGLLYESAVELVA